MISMRVILPDKKLVHHSRRNAESHDHDPEQFTSRLVRRR